MNLERISEALQSYTGQEDSMHAVTAVLQEELGDNWTETVFDDLQGLAPALKENLTHVFNYYAATMAWNEIQGYLADPDLQNTPELQERLPVLKHWLDFFGAPGQAAYQSLEDRLSGEALPSENADGTDAADDSEANAGASDLEEMASEEDEKIPSAESEETKEDLPVEETEISDPVEALSKEEDVPNVEETTEEPVPENDTAQADDSPEAFEISKLNTQVELLDKNQAWLAARCIQLKDIEIYAYPFYGYIVDMMRQIIKSMNAILENEAAKNLVETKFPGGMTAFDNKKQAIEQDIALAEQNCESATTALISEDMDMDEVKRTLGTIDDSDTVEYVGPAPDGFELIDDETPLDETAIKKQYEKLENMDALTGDKTEQSSESNEAEENTSQTQQKGVQRKLSFSLKRKKPAGGTN